ncbi:MAG: DUF3365 domain-containing protein, partial [Ferruginibacter sp.]
MKCTIFYISILVIALFTACNNSNKNNDSIKSDYTKMGNSIVKKTFDTLRSSLQTAISQSGFEGAVPYCKTAAYSLTNIYASDSVTIRRTALKYRNPRNKPDTSEERILKIFASLKEQGIINDSIKPITEESKNGEVHFYKPIMLQQMCASCHGSKSTDIQPSVWKAINALYPFDMAYDFKTGDLRGMWHIRFTK